MVLFLDHVAIAVRDLNAAKHFFGLLGFEVADAVVIHGEQFSRLRGFEPLSSPVQDPPRPRAVRGAAAGARSDVPELLGKQAEIAQLHRWFRKQL